jgi:hypothetical protein
MNPEIICDLSMVKADYRWIEHKTRTASNGFRIKFDGGQIDVDEADANQFATEIEALAALIRARLSRSPQSK